MLAQNEKTTNLGRRNNSPPKKKSSAFPNIGPPRELSPTTLYLGLQGGGNPTEVISEEKRSSSKLSVTKFNL
jgi:hypothetical protein